MLPDAIVLASVVVVVQVYMVALHVVDFAVLHIQKYVSEACKTLYQNPIHTNIGLNHGENA